MTPGTIGFFEDMPDEQYFGTLACSNSLLKHFELSPAHALAAFKKPRTTTAALRFGSAFDCLVTQPELFKKRYVSRSGIAWTTKDGKAEKAELLEQVESEDYILTPDE